MSTGERVSMITRQPSKEAARAYAEAAITEDADLRIAEIRARFECKGVQPRGWSTIVA
jgi:hypothetical protein